MKRRHIPRADVLGDLGPALCGRIVRYRRSARVTRAAYVSPANREGACAVCVRRLEEEEATGTQRRSDDGAAGSDRVEVVDDVPAPDLPRRIDWRVVKMAQVSKAAGPAKAQKSYGVNLSGANRSALRFLAVIRKDGSVNAFGTHIVRGEDGKVASSTRGASSSHKTLDAAIKWVDAAVEQATKLGWARRSGGGGHSKPDAFTLDSLPKSAK